MVHNLKIRVVSKSWIDSQLFFLYCIHIWGTLMLQIKKGMDNRMNLLDYLKRNRFLWMLAFLFMGLCHGTMMLGNTIGIDTEDIINLQGAFYGGWLTTGRQGLVLLKKLTDNAMFNPQLAGAATLLFLTGACILWTYLFAYISKKENLFATAGFCIVFTVSTILTEQLYFKLQSMEVALGFCLMAWNLFFIYRTLELQMQGQTKRLILIGRYAITIGVNLILFSIYQAMVPLYIFGAVACFYLHYYFHTDMITNGYDVVEKQKDSKSLCGFLGILIGVFLVSFLLNQLITSLFFSGSDYLQSQFLWFSQPFTSCLLNIWNHMKEVMIGTQIYYVKTFVIYCVLLIASCVFFFKRHPEKKAKVFGVIALLGVLLAPFYMTIICGHAPVIRAQLVLPFTVAFMVYVLFLVADGKKVMTYALLVIGFVTAYLQLRYTMLLNYSDQVRYESDVRMASSMIERIDLLQNEECSYPVVFIGTQSAKLNNSCIKGEVIGYSFFEWDAAVEPYGYYNSRRVLGLMQTMGVNYTWADVDTTKAAYEYSQDMKSWPAKESVALYQDTIIVKLSDWPQ